MSRFDNNPDNCLDLGALFQSIDRILTSHYFSNNSILYHRWRPLLISYNILISSLRDDSYSLVQMI